MQSINIGASCLNDMSFKRWMPYHFRHAFLREHEFCFVPLNRSYQLLGGSGHKIIDANEFADSHGIVFWTDPRKIKNVWHNRDDLYLYSDALDSRNTYGQRLEELMRYRIK